MFDCGHDRRVEGCGGCDPGAIDFVITDEGVRRPFDAALDMSAEFGDRRRRQHALERR